MATQETTDSTKVDFVKVCPGCGSDLYVQFPKDSYGNRLFCVVCFSCNWAKKIGSPADIYEFVR